ncbi:MAG: MFS transporter [bacterium]
MSASAHTPTTREYMAYGLLGMPLAMLSLPLYVYLPTFYAEITTLSLTTIGLVLLAARLFDMLIDPLIGWLNDRHYTPRTFMRRWHLGRRQWFMLLGLPITLLGLVGLLQPHAHTSAFELLLFSMITYLGWTLLNVPWQAWGAEISRHYHQKSILAASREGFAVIGTVLVLSLPVILGLNNDFAKILALLLYTLWGLLPFSLVILLLVVYEPTPTRTLKSMQMIGGLIAPHPAIKPLLFPYFVNSLANALPATLFILFVTHVLKASDATGVLLLTYFVAALLGLPLWYLLSKRWDKSRTWSISLLLAIGSFLIVPFLGAGDVTVFWWICVFSGLALGADVALPASMQADIAQQQVSQGNPQTGLLFGLWSLLTKLALALGVGLAFPLLALTGFDVQQPSDLSTNAQLDIPPTTMLMVLYAVIPLVLKLWVAWRMWHYPFAAIDFHDYWESPDEKN